MSQHSLFQCSKCKATVFSQENVKNESNVHYYVDQQQVVNSLERDGFIFICSACHAHIGDEFDNVSIIIRKDHVTEVKSTDETTPKDPTEAMQRDIERLNTAVAQLRSTQDEIKRAIVLLKESFETQIVDLKRSILHLASEMTQL